MVSSARWAASALAISDDNSLRTSVTVCWLSVATRPRVVVCAVRDHSTLTAPVVSTKARGTLTIRAVRIPTRIP